MRRLWPIGLAALALAVAASTPTWAGEPDNCQVCGQPQPAGIVHRHVSNNSTADAPQPRKKVKLGHLCDKCVARLRAQGGPATPGGPVLAGEMPTGLACAKCGQHHGATTIVTGGPQNAPGFAVVGRVPTNMMAANGGVPPGYAVVGGSIVSSEPAPVGVVQAGYRPQGMLPPPAGTATGAALPAAPTAIAPPPGRRPHILSHLFFFSGRTLPEDIKEYRMARKEANHAAISYGDNAKTVDQVPASVVYGRNGSN